MKNIILSVILLVISMYIPVVCIVKSIRFDQYCGGYLKQAVDANTTEIALDRINRALEYLESKGFTHGYTSALWETEDENIGFWYNNIKACQKELIICTNGTQLEKANVLMKVRESLTDTNEGDTVLTIPKGISRYPHNGTFGVLIFLSKILFIISITILIISIIKYKE